MNLNQPSLIIEPSKGWTSLQLRQLWHYRELLFFLVWRDLRVRYKQTVLGVGWVILQPVLSTVVFAFLFGQLLGVDSGQTPYPLFALAGLLPWNYFAGALSRGGNSLVNNAQLLTKVYFPRLVIPLSTVLGGLIDWGIGLLVLLGGMAIYGVEVNRSVIWLPAFLLLAIFTALGAALWLAALNVQYRDIGYLIPFVIQIGMYVTPVVYGSDLIPVRFRFWLALNPMTAVVEGFRWSLLGGSPPTGQLLWVSIGVIGLLFVSGLFFFRHTERTFADII